MLQKTTWTHYLIIGISVLIFSSVISCDKGEVDERHTATFIYKNNSGKNLIMKVFNTSSGISEEYSIDIDESKPIICKGNPNTAPFFSVDNSLIGDSLVIIFEDNKCITFTREINDGVVANEGTGLFNIQNYDDYNIETVNKKNYTLYYTIGTELYNSATNCN